MVGVRKGASCATSRQAAMRASCICRPKKPRSTKKPLMSCTVRSLGKQDLSVVGRSPRSNHRVEMLRLRRHGLGFALRYTHHRRPQEAVMHDVAGLQHLDHRTRGLSGILLLEDCLMEIMVEALAQGVDPADPMSFEGSEQLALGSADALQKRADELVRYLRLRQTLKGAA